MNEEGKIDYLSPLTVFSFVLAFFGDIAFIFIIGALIPVIGLVILFGILAMHYFTGVLIGFIIVPKLQHLIPKLVLILAILLPLPPLLLGLISGILLQNNLIEQIAIQLAIVAAGAATGGAGAVAGETALAGGGASAGAVAAETGAGAAAAGAETTVAGAETGAAGAEAGAARGQAGGATEAEGMERGKGASRQHGETTEEDGNPEKEISDEALGEEKNPFEKLQELTEKTPDSGQREDGDEDEDQSVNIDDEANEVDLKKAA